jgi:hypothetical protein
MSVERNLAYLQKCQEKLEGLRWQIASEVQIAQLEAEIEVKDENLIRTGNPGRDLTLFQHFFSHIKKRHLLMGRIQEVKSNGNQGEFDLLLTLNQKTKRIPFTFTWNEGGQFEASGALDVLDFGLAGALKDLHQTCEVLHRGPDGVSKTWSQVDLKLIAKIGKTCTP